MSNDTASLPRKKGNILWWLFGLLFVLFLLFLYQLFGPSPAIVVSRDTTYITTPLNPNGLPDYEQHLLDHHREGLTPENNAAVPLWQVFRPEDTDPQDHALVLAEIGVDHMPTEEESLDKLYSGSNHRNVVVWLYEQERFAGHRTATSDAAIKELLDEAPYDSWSAEAREWWNHAQLVIDATMTSPWKSEDIPPLAEWLTENEQKLDMLVEASKKPRFFSPPAELIQRNNEVLLLPSLDSMQTMRAVARILLARAMWHAGEARYDEARQNFLAIRRWARLIAQGELLVDQLVAIAIDGIAHEGTVTLLSLEDLPASTAKRIHQELATLPPVADLTTAYDSGERLFFLSILVHAAARGAGHEAFITWSGDSSKYEPIDWISIDWNIVLRELNQWFDRLAAAASLTDQTARKQAFSQIHNELAQREHLIYSPKNLFMAALSRHQRSRRAGELLATMSLPAFQGTVAAENRAITSLTLTQLAAALAVYRAEHGQYPATLADLLPDVLNDLPVDVYNAKPFVYKHTDDGYVLYSTGENGTDDGGNAMHESFEGQSLYDLDDATADKLRTKIPESADDIAIRVPRPGFKLPDRPASQ